METQSPLWTEAGRQYLGRVKQYVTGFHLARRSEHGICKLVVGK